MKILTFFLLSLMSAWMMLAGTQVSIASSTNLATVGDRIDLTLILKSDETFDRIHIARNPDAPFELIEEQSLPVREMEEYRVYETHWVITFFELGDFEIGPVPIQLVAGDRVVATHHTRVVPVTVKSVLQETDRDIRPPKSPLKLQGDPLYVMKFVALILGVAVLILLIVHLIRRRRNTPVSASAPPLSPMEELIRSIEALMRKGWLEKGEYKSFHIELVHSIKRFLQRVHDINAQDMTTRETIETLRTMEIDQRIPAELETLFSLSDLIKFAKYTPAGDHHDHIRSEIQRFTSLYPSKQHTGEARENDSPGQ